MSSQTDTVEADIIARILSRQLLPGDRIDDADLRERLGVSATPVREAFMRLDAKRIITRRSSGGVFLTRLDLADLLRLNEALSEIEGAIAFHAAQRISRAQLGVLETAIARCEAAGQDANLYYDANIDFHCGLIAACANPALQEAAYGFALRIIGYIVAKLDLPGQIEKSNLEHRRIHEAVASGQPDLARDLMIRHIKISDTVAIGIMGRMADGAPRIA